jgi:hypothetical protein
MSGSQIAPLFNIGPTIAGQILGLPYQQYRANGSCMPLNFGNLVGTIQAWITSDRAGKGSKPFVAKDPIAYGMFDPTVTVVGDYLVGPLGTFFIASQDVPMPIQVVRCNQTITVMRPSAEAIGDNFYGGAESVTGTPMLSEWPASVIQGTKGETGEVKLPGDTRLAWVAIMLPSVAGVQILPGDWILTGQSTIMEFTVSSCEITPLGWRLSAASAVA